MRLWYDSLHGKIPVLLHHRFPVFRECHATVIFRECHAINALSIGKIYSFKIQTQIRAKNMKTI